MLRKTLYYVEIRKMREILDQIIIYRLSVILEWWTYVNKRNAR